jgi:hypothetical protein
VIDAELDVPSYEGWSIDKDRNDLDQPIVASSEEAHVAIDRGDPAKIADQIVKSMYQESFLSLLAARQHDRLGIFLGHE